jgi:hypothetical protein
MLISRLVPELPVNGSQYTTFESANDRVSASRVRARRQWILRTGLLLGLTGLSLTLLVLWRRDPDTVALLTRANQKCATAIQAHLDSTGLLPASLPDAENSYCYYASYANRFYAQRTSRPVIIAATAPISLILHSDGRCVIIFERGRVRSEWMTAVQFSDAYQAQIQDQARFEHDQRDRIPKLP